MNKKEFLRELEYNLSGKVSDDELKNILMDYDELFESNKTENKTEEETAESIGSPAAVCKNILDDYTGKSTKSQPEDVDYHFASIGRRIAAFIIDCIISLLPAAIFSGVPNVVFIAPFNPLTFLSFGVYTSKPADGQFTLNIICVSIFWLYGTISMILLKNRTPGMYLMKIKVIKANNTKLKAFDIIVREFLGKILIPGLTFGLSHVVSFFWALFSKRNNTVHDKIAGTLVVDNIKQRW